MTKSKLIIVCLAIAAVGATSFAVLSNAADKKGDTGASAKQAAMQRPAPVIAVPVVKQDIPQVVSAVGSLLASESADIHSETAGKIEKIHFTEGQPVEKDAVLLEIDSSLTKTDLAKAEAAYRVAASTLTRDSKLYASKYISTQELDESKANLQQKKAEMESARIRHARTTVKAPFDGLVGLRAFSVGDYVEVGHVLTTIDAYDPIKIEFSIPERSYSAIKIDQKITFETDAWPGETFEGTVYALDSRINPQTRSVAVKATAPNSDGKLRAGMYARIQIETDIAGGSLVIPEEAVFSRGEKDFVFTIKDGKAVNTPITIQSRQNGQVAVAEGLSEGDSVIGAGVQRVRDGMNVAPQQAQQNTQ